MAKQSQVTKEPISLRTAAPRDRLLQWCGEARRIVAYPGDYGITRHQARGLERMLTNRLRADR